MMLTRRALPWVASLALATGTRAQAPVDARLKARLTLSLARFTQWPAKAFAGPADPLSVCVLDRSQSLAAAFQELSGQQVAGRPVRIVMAAEVPAPACHVLYVHESADRGTPGLGLGGAVMTIGDAEGFSSRGGMVELVNVNDSLRMDINLKSLRAADLSLSSQVLKLARQVRE